MPVIRSTSGSGSAAANDLSTANGIRRLSILQKEVTELDAASAAELAASNLADDEMLQTARSSISVASRGMSIASMREMDEDKQRSQWSKMSTGQQKFYLEAGYAPPGPKKEQYVSWWEHPQHWGMKGVGAVAGAVADRWDRFGLDSLWSKSNIGKVVGGTFERVTNLMDDIKDRPVRAMDDRTGQSEAGRFRMKVAKAKSILEKNGTTLSDDEWQNIFYRYGELNKKSITYTTTDRNFDNAAPANQGVQIAKEFSEAQKPWYFWKKALTWLQGETPSWLLNNSFEQQRTENLFEPNVSGANVADNIFEQFRTIADELSDDPKFQENVLASWNRADSGEKYLSAAYEYENLQNLGGNFDTLDLAKEIARGKRVSDYLVEKQQLDPDTPEFAELFAELNNNIVTSEEFQNVVKNIKSDESKFSMGRGLATMMGLPRDSAAFTFYSGTADALAAMTLDPVNVVGPGFKLTRIARYGIAPSEIAVAAALDSAKTVSRGEKAFRLAEEGAENTIKIIQIADNPAVRTGVAEATDVLTTPRLNNRLLDAGIPQDTLEAGVKEGLLDADGYPTQFFLDNYDEIQTALVEETRSLMVDRLGKSTNLVDVIDDAGLKAVGEVPRYMVPMEIAEESLSKIDVLLSVMMRTGRPIIDTASNSKTFNWFQKTSLRGTTQWMDRVVQGFEDARAGVPNAIAKLTEDLPYGRVVVPVLVDLETKLSAKGLTGITERADLWKWLQTDGLYRLGTGEITGSNIRGFGNGQNIRDTWRVFGRMTDDVPLVRNRNELAQLPRLTGGTKLLRKFINASDSANLSILARKENESMLKRLGMWSPRKAAGVLWKLGHQVPKNQWLPLAGEEGVVEFRKLLDLGVLANIDKDVLDKYFDDFIRGIPVETGTAGQSNMFENELKTMLSLLDGAGDSAIGANLVARNGDEWSLSEFVKVVRNNGGLQITPELDKWFQEIANSIIEVIEKEGVEALTEKDLKLQKYLESFREVKRNPVLASRIMVEKKFMRLLFEAGGVYETEVGREFADTFLNHVERFRYTPNDEDLMVMRTAADEIEAIRIGVMPVANYAGRLGIPNVTEFLRVMRNISMTGRVLRTLNADFISAAMTNVWKPLTLMRLGFIPRAAGEEYLAFYARRGIWAPLSSIASNIAENRRGMVFGPLDRLAKLPNYAGKISEEFLDKGKTGLFNRPLNHLAKLPAKFWGEASRAGLGEELTNLAAVLQFKNKAEYMTHVARVLDVSENFGMFDYLQLASHYHTANMIRSLRSFEFKLLPKTLQRGVLAVMGQTDNAALAEGLGLIDIATINKAMKRDTAMLLRNPLGQQVFAEQQTSIGGMIAAPNGIEDPATRRLVIKTSPFDRTDRGEVILLEDREWNVFDPAEQAAESMLNDVTPLYTLMDNDPIVGAAITPIVGKITEDDLLTYVDPLLKDTTWGVDAVLRGFDGPESTSLNQMAVILEENFPRIEIGEFQFVNDQRVFSVDEEKLLTHLAGAVAPFPSSIPMLHFAYDDPNANTMVRYISSMYYRTLDKAAQNSFSNNLSKKLIDVIQEDNGLLPESDQFSMLKQTFKNSSFSIEDHVDLFVKNYLDIKLQNLDDSVLNNFVEPYDPANPLQKPLAPFRPRNERDVLDRQLDFLEDERLYGDRRRGITDPNFGMAEPTFDFAFDSVTRRILNQPSYKQMTDIVAEIKVENNLPIASLFENPEVNQYITNYRDAIMGPEFESITDDLLGGIRRYRIDHPDADASELKNFFVETIISTNIATKTDAEILWKMFDLDTKALGEPVYSNYFVNRQLPIPSLINNPNVSYEAIMLSTDLDEMFKARRLLSILQESVNSGSPLYGTQKINEDVLLSEIRNYNWASVFETDAVNNIDSVDELLRQTRTFVDWPNTNFGSEENFRRVLTDTSELNDNYLLRNIAGEDQWFVDEDGALHFLANISGRNQGKAISTAHGDAAVDFASTWTGDTTFAIDKQFSEKFTRGWGADQPYETELATASGELIVPAGEWKVFVPNNQAPTMWNPELQKVVLDQSKIKSGAENPISRKRPYTRHELIIELERIVRGDLPLEDSLLWSKPVDDGVVSFLENRLMNKSVKRIPIQIAQRQNVQKIADESLEQLRLYIQTLPKKIQNQLQEFMQGDIAFAGKTGLSDLFKAAAIDRTKLPAAVNNALDFYPTGSRFEELVVAAFLKAQDGDSRLMEALTFMVASPKRLGQSVLNDIPISIANPIADREAVAMAAKANLMNPDYRFFVDANPRSIQDPITGQQVVKAPLTGTTTLYGVLVDEYTASMILGLKENMDDPLRGFNALRTSLIEKGATDDEIELIHQMFIGYDSVFLNKTFGEASTQSPLSMFANVAFTDYNQSQRISQLLTDGIMGAGEYRPYDFNVSTSRPTTLPYAEAAKVNVVDADNVFERIGNHPTAVQIIDPAVMDRMEAIDKAAGFYRFNDMGELDDAGQHVVTGVTHNELMDQFAESIADLIFNSLTNSSNGSYLHEIIGPLHRGTFGVNALAQVSARDFPRQLMRPTRFVAPQSPWRDLVNFGFGKVINPAIFSIVRSPMYMLGLSDGLEWARSTTNHLRDKALDASFEKRVALLANGLDTEDVIIEIQNVWSMIPEHVRTTLNTVDQFDDEIAGLIYNGKLDPESPLANAHPEDLELILDWVRKDSALEKVNMQIANKRAINDVIPFIDDNSVRSFFQEYVKNLIPFQFAQESFLKRWAKTTIYSPEAFRRVQLLVHGLNSSGFVHDDPTSGKRVFVFPMTESLQDLFGKVPGMNVIFGQGFEVPVSNMMTGQINNILPGVPNDFQNLPALSPLGMIPASAIAEQFPETKPFISLMSSGRAVNTTSLKNFTTSAISQFFPANYQRLYTSITGHETILTKGEMQKGTISAMAQLESQAIVLRGELELIEDKESEVAIELAQKIRTMSLADDATDVEIERYAEKVRDWTRANMMVRGFLGFIAPTSPSNEFENEDLAPEIGELLRYMDMDEALAVFLTNSPEGQPWSVFASAKTTKAPLTPTAAALGWMTKNRGFMDQYPKAAPWLMPQAKAADEYSQQAYTDMVAAGFKFIKDPVDWYKDLKFASAANIYFPSKLRKDVMLENATSSEERRRIEDRWNLWADTFKKQHPIFANQLTAQINNDAELVLKELSDVLSFDESVLPEVEHMESLRVMVDGYESYMYEIRLMKGQNSKAVRTKRDNLRKNFILWGQGFVSANPEMQKVWNSLVLPATELTSTVALEKALKGN